MTDTKQYVTYHVAQQHKAGFKQSSLGNHTQKAFNTLGHGYPLNPEDAGSAAVLSTLSTTASLSSSHSTASTSSHVHSHPAVQEFIKNKPNTSIVDSFVEMPENKRASRWPQLQKAIECCRQHNAELLIVELGTLTSNESFTQCLLASGISFHCIDQPFVDQTILEALSKHAEVQRKLHGELIRKGLKMTSAKSGNPNAAAVISRVNKPKIDTAIVFAFLLQPIIQDYRRKGYSQRQMVKSLNEEGFTAPEGGKWVLSQLQKVLDRVRLNEIATELKSSLEDFKSRGLTMLQMAENLNVQSQPAIKSTPWDESQIKKLLDRTQQIQDIVLINRFVLNLLPVLHYFRKQNFSTTQMLREFELAGISVRNTRAMA